MNDIKAKQEVNTGFVSPYLSLPNFLFISKVAVVGFFDPKIKYSPYDET